MSKFHQVSKALDKHTDTCGRVQYLVRWRGFGTKYDSWVNEDDTNERLKQVFRTGHQGRHSECYIVKKVFGKSL